MRNWPLFDLTIRTPRLELCLPSLEELDELAERAAEGVHAADEMPFTFPWSAAESGERARGVVQFHFGAWAGWRPDNWRCEFVVKVDGQVVGTQGIAATDFAVKRDFHTGSWLGQRFQGRGIGTEMRRAVLHFAFTGLGAEWATTSAFEDNPASLGVTRKLGYREDGIEVHSRLGKPAVTKRFRLHREDWAAAPDVEIAGLERCLDLFGVAAVD